MKYALVLAVLLAVAACTEKVVKTWVGHGENELYKVNGRPTRTMANASGGKVIAYDVMDSKGKKFCERSFAVSNNGTITSASTDCWF
jgi:hypothetical protein